MTTHGRELTKMSQPKHSIYLDACLWIDLVRLSESESKQILQSLKIISSGPFVLALSHLLEVEVLSQELSALTAMYDLESVFTGVIDYGVCAHARELRIERSRRIPVKQRKVNPEACGFRTADSLHVAVAKRQGCRYFLTNDKGIRKLEAISVELRPLEVITPEQFNKVNQDHLLKTGSLFPDL